MISVLAGKSGKPWAKLTAFSGPLSARLRRVISRMTLSVKLSALRLRSGAGTLNRSLRAGGERAALQPKGVAGAEVARGRRFEAAVSLPARLAGPQAVGEEFEDVGAADEAHH